MAAAEALQAETAAMGQSKAMTIEAEGFARAQVIKAKGEAEAAELKADGQKKVVITGVNQLCIGWWSCLLK